MAKRRDEEINQVAFVRWFRLQYPKYAHLMTLGSFGENVGPRRMERLKEMGLVPGYPDLAFYIPKIIETDEDYLFIPGLFIEMKTLKGKVSLRQKVIHDALIAQGYEVEVARSWDEAKNQIKSYMVDVS